MPWIAVISILVGAVQGHMIVLRGMQAPASIFTAECIRSATWLIVGIPAIWVFGVRGAVAAFFLSSIAGLIGVILLLHRRIEKRRQCDVGN